MADNVRVVSSRSLVREESVQYIRAINISLTLVDARPNTRMYVFFGEDDVTNLCAQDGQQLGTPIFTNELGQASIRLAIPGGKFNVGTYAILVADTNDMVALNSTGSVFGSARGEFSASGRIRFFQETQTTITTVERIVEIVRPRPQPNWDPLAQSFFTFGVGGGIFLTSIDLFFQTKDENLPVTIELRELVNGIPTTTPVSNINFVSTVAPADVKTSSDGSAATKFEFNPPVYLREDAEFCFVVRSNSNGYNLFTSKMGEPSYENGVKIFENPFIGTLFKSANNITWTPEQFEDIKFVIRKAVFQSSGTAQFAAQVPPVIADGTQFSTVSGSNVITYRSNQEHGLEDGSVINIIARTAGTYNGIPGSELNGTHTIPSGGKIDRNTIQFTVTTNATSTGQMTTSGGVMGVMVKESGTGYTSSDVISFIGGGGSGAAGTIEVNVDGAITGVTMTNYGTGYTSTPTVTVTTSTGSGHELVAITTPVFTVYQNKPMTAFKPNINIYNFATSKTTNSISTKIGNYEGGNLVTYSEGKNFDFVEYDDYVNLSQNSVVASPYNEEAIVGENSAVVNITLETTNPNVSPVIDLKKIPELTVYSSKINNQPYDDLTATDTTGIITGFASLVGGSGYTQTPVVTIDPPYYPWGIQATATAALTGNAVSGITLTNAGSGYITQPNVTISRGAGDTTGAGASVQATINTFNSELLATGGLAKARYVTRKTTLQMISNGVRILSTISSVPGSSVDWYIRTSLSGSNTVHEDQQWQKLLCFVDRNKSSYPGEVFEYEFGLDGILEFDTYDLKCVLLAEDPTKAPVVTGYRVIVVA